MNPESFMYYDVDKYNADTTKFDISVESFFTLFFKDGPNFSRTEFRKHMISVMKNQLYSMYVDYFKKEETDSYTFGVWAITEFITSKRYNPYFNEIITFKAGLRLNNLHEIPEKSFICAIVYGRDVPIDELDSIGVS